MQIWRVNVNTQTTLKQEPVPETWERLGGCGAHHAG